MLISALVALAGATALAAAGKDSGSARWSAVRVSGAGIAARYPAGWKVIRASLTDCTDPVQRLALSSTGNPDRGMLVVIEERLESDDNLPPRPAHFRLKGRAQPLECCTPTSRAGFGVHFSDGGRGFYAYVYADGAASRAVAAEVLDSLRIAPRTPAS